MNMSKLRVGEVGEKVVTGKNGKKRVIVMKRIASTGFPQFRIIGNKEL